MNHPCAHARRQFGFTLVESLMVLAVTAIVLGAAAPHFGAALERRHLEGASAQLETDIQFARSAAGARNHTLRIAFTSQAGGSCYIVHTGRANDCRCTPEGQAVCQGAAMPIRTAAFAVGGPLQLRSNVGAMIFDPAVGTVTPTGTLRFTGRQGHEVRLIVNIMGRVRSCTPSPDLRGYPRC